MNYRITLNAYLAEKYDVDEDNPIDAHFANRVGEYIKYEVDVDERDDDGEPLLDKETWGEIEAWYEEEYPERCGKEAA